MVRRLYSGVKRVLEVVVPALFILMLAVMTWQVAARYLTGQPSTLTEELSRILIMWMGVLGSALTWAEHRHIAVDLLQRKLPPALRLRCEQFTYLATTFFGVILFTGGVELVRNAFVQQQTTAALGVSMGYVFLVLPLGALCFLIFSLEFFVNGAPRRDG